MHNRNRPCILPTKPTYQSFQRFNVALTRAKAKAIIIGNPLCLEKDEKWREYINICRSFGTHLGFDTRLERSDQVVEQLKQNVRAFNELMITN